MITENLSTLKIHKLTQAQYERELEAGSIDDSALYLTPDEVIDLSPYATKEELSGKANMIHTHEVSDVVNLQSSLNELLEESKAYVNNAVSDKADSSHTHIVGNISDLTATATELNYIKGATSNIQTQLDGKATLNHNHSASNITSGILSSDRLPIISIANGGTGATTGVMAMENLFSSGVTVLSSYQYGYSLPEAGTVGRIFFKRVST